MSKLHVYLISLFWLTVQPTFANNSAVMGLNLDIDDYTAVPGETFCLDVTVSDFIQIVSFQYTLNWDPTVMEFSSIEGLNLPNPDNFLFNENFTDIGQLLLIWFDPIGAGNDLPNGTVIYQLCFTALDAIGSSTEIGFSNLPLTIEVTDIAGGGQHIGLNNSGGNVSIAAPIEVDNVNVADADCNAGSPGSINLDASGGVAPLSFQWTGPGSYAATTEDAINLVNVGNYYLTITDASIPPLVYMDSFVVDGNYDPPAAMVADPTLLNCINTTIDLDGTGSAVGANFTYQWTTTNGNIVDGVTSLMPTVDMGGSYQLQVINAVNNCSNFVTVIVEADTVSPQVIIADPGMIDCQILTDTLDGTASSNDIEFTALWSTTDGSIVSGADTYEAVVNLGGTYELMITNTSNGCTNTSSVEVISNIFPPDADAGLEQLQNCPGETLSLDGSDSASGAMISYAWSTTNGNILSGETTLTPEVDALGTYTLVVTDEANGCTAISSVEVLIDPSLQQADAGADFSICGDTTTLQAILPIGNTGMWTSTSAAIIANPSEANSFLSAVPAGNSTFVWTLSTAACPSYTQDTVILNAETSPSVSDDAFEIAFGDNPFMMDLVANDGILQLSSWSTMIVDAPANGSLSDLGDGQYSYSFPNDFFGEVNFTYELCNTACPDLCEEAMVFLDVSKQVLIDTSVALPNGITPNGDGVNETFIIPALEDNPEQYPDREMVIFNRWGNIVYKARPYQNDWDGEGLPEGTYYFILNLDISEGLLLKGDITILR